MSESNQTYGKGPTESILSTMNQDGSRNWLRPKLAKGKHYYRRFAVAWGLILTFVVIPHLTMSGKPLMLFDIPKRQFTLFGTTFFATETPLLLLLLLGLFLSIFLFTALAGRVWCGWGCPQTVYMEFVFRPIERLLEGSPAQQRKLDKQGGSPRRVLKYFIYLLLSMFLAHVFLSYFVGTTQLWEWMHRSPFKHPSTFLIMAGVTAMIFFDFSYFREQTCLVACPYGRFQSVLLDKHSAIVAYDYNRGEPRAKKRQRSEEPPEGAESWGDCIQCKACVLTCPTGIDIREGLQMECINCTQCIDACDDIMEKIHKPKGLIRYTSQQTLETNQKQGILRPRVLLYPLLILIIFTALGMALARREAAEVTILRGGSNPYKVLPNGQISNHIKIKIANRTPKLQKYKIKLIAPKGVSMITPINPLVVAAQKTETAVIFVLAPRAMFTDNGSLPIQFTIDNSSDYKTTRKYKLLGLLKGINPSDLK